MKRFLVMIALTASPVAADEAALNAYVASFEAEDPAACEATFAEGATFVDLGNDLSERISWFCQAVVDGNGTYTLLAQSTDGSRTEFEMDYRAGGYFAETRGHLIGENGKISELVIERR